MTAPELLACITVALVVQLTAGIGVAVWRRRDRAAQAPIPTGLDTASASASSAAWPGWREFRVARREFEDAARTQCSFHLQPVDGVPLPPFKPGQFLTFALPLERTPIRCYSLSDRPTPTAYRVTIKRVPAPAGRPELPPGASSSYFHDSLHEGDVIKVKAPSGQFFIDPDPTVSSVLVAGGIGITPLLSMLRWCLEEQPERPVHLYYGLRSGEGHAFKKTLQELAGSHPNFQLHVVFSHPRPEDLEGRDFRHRGYVDVDLLRRTLPHGRHQFYVCGPPPMMQVLVPALAQWGVPEEDIHFEAFGPASVRAAQGPEKAAAPSVTLPVEVRFHRSGRTLLWDGQDASLLDFAERHDVAVDAGCRSGSCGTCETRLVSGSVRYAHRPDHEVAPGHCLLCVGTPLSALVLEA